RNKFLSKKSINDLATKYFKHKNDSTNKALYQLYQLCPNLNGQSVWFFLMLKKSAEGWIFYNKSEKHAYVYNMIIQKQYPSFSTWIKALSNKRFFKGKKSALSTIFLNPSYSKISVSQIIKKEDHVSYFKNTKIVTLSFIKDTLATMKYNNAEFEDLTFTEKLYIKQMPYGCREPIECSILVNGFEVKDYILKDSYINKRILTIDDVFSIMQFCRKSSVCMGQYTK
ncbi:27801_t:CDS:2, partial [Gigaspora margarita]